MTGMAVTTFVLAGLLLLMACVKADRVRAWRTARNPSAPDVSNASFVVVRLLLVAMAAGGIVTGFQGLKAQDDIGWSDDELTSAVEGATASLNGSSAHGGPLDGPDTPEDFDGAYGIKVRQEIVEHGSGDAPQFGVSAEVTGEATADHARYAVSADGASAWFCMDVTRAHTGWAETVAPGGLGESSKVRLPEFTYQVTSRAGEC
ncbi:hypothetical protein [Streptomyces zhihengii]|uniref:hypothetical protein n=1 Tax=Streptomyces zhihengii TaxID=1818004 RepID=UPI0033B29858